MNPTSIFHTLRQQNADEIKDSRVRESVRNLRTRRARACRRHYLSQQVCAHGDL